MPAKNVKYLDTRGNDVLGVGICDRCGFKFPLGDLVSDGNLPGLKVCRWDRDVYDPYRLSPPPPDKFNLPFVRPDVTIEPPEANPPEES